MSAHFTLMTKEILTPPPYLIHKEYDTFQRVYFKNSFMFLQFMQNVE